MDNKTATTILIILAIAIASLNCIGSIPEPTLEKLIDQLVSEDGETKPGISLEICKRSEESDDVIPALVDALNSESPQMRAAVAETLALIAISQPIPEEPLIQLLEDNNPKVRISSAYALGINRDDPSDVLYVFIEEFKNDDWRIRSEAAFIFVHFGQDRNQNVPEAIPYLMDLLNDENDKVRGGAAMALWHFGSLAVPSLAEALANDNPEVRGCATTALRAIGPEAVDAAPALIKTLEDVDEEVRFGAARALARILQNDAGKAVPNLITGLESEDQDTRFRAAKALALIGPNAKDAVPTLLKVLKTEKGAARRDIAFALTRIDESHIGTGVNVLIEELDNDDQVARLLAAKYLGEIGPDAALALAKLKELAETEEVDYVRKAMSDAIEKIEIDDTTETK